MKKLYFKKLVFMALYTALFFLVYFILFSFLGTVAGFFENLIIRALIVFGIPMIIMIVFVYRKRSDNSEKRREYLQYMQNEIKISLKKEISFLIKDSYFISEVLAFSTVLTLFLIPIGVGIEGPFYAVLLGGIVIFMLFDFVYILVDFALWVLVHRKWLINP